VKTKPRPPAIGRADDLINPARLPHSSAAVDLTIVVPLFNEEASVEELHAGLASAVAEMSLSYEVIYVDDGSRDGTFARLEAIAAADRHAVVIRFRRNFGQTAALQAGIDYSRGDVLVFMDGDLQNDPRDIAELYAKIQQGYDVVSGWRANRQDPFWSRRLPSHVANWLISKVTGVHLHDYGCTLKAYRRQVVESSRLYGEMHRFIPAYAAASGASITEMPVSHHARRHGKSKYGISRTIRVLFDLLTVKFLGSFATKPLYVFGSLGLALWGLAVLAGVEVIWEKLAIHTYAHQNPILLVAVFCGILGMQFFVLGLLAEVLVRTYHESQDKPTFLIRDIVSSDPARLPE
jgi:glycosyltransferase involved in cell wall biosynthesis